MFNDCPQQMRNTMNSHIKEYYDLSQLRHLIITKSSECKRARKQNKNYQVKPGEINNLKAACKALVRADRYNGSLLRGVMAAEIQNDEQETIRVYETMIERVPQNLKAYFDYYKYMKRFKRMDKINNITKKMMKAIEDPSVPTNEWMEAHITRADCLVELKFVDEAIEILENLVHIIPPLPIPGLSYLIKLEQRKSEPNNNSNRYKNNDNETVEASGTIHFTYDTSKNTKSVDFQNEKAQFGKSEISDDEESKGAIQIKVIPSEDHTTNRKERLQELSETMRSRGYTNRNARPLSNSLFLSTPKGVSLFI